MTNILVIVDDKQGNWGKLEENIQIFLNRIKYLTHKSKSAWEQASDEESKQHLHFEGKSHTLP